MTTSNNKGLDSAIVDSFIIEVTLIEPIESIIVKLKSGNFRDCDIEWLDVKLFNFTSLAAKTLGINIPVQPPTDKATTLNDYVKNKYIGYFTVLLSYFKSF